MVNDRHSRHQGFPHIAVVLGLLLICSCHPPAPAPRPELEDSLKTYFAQREVQANQLIGTHVVPELKPFFKAGARGDWQSMTNLYFAMAGRSYQFANPTTDPQLDTPAWQCINESFRAYEALGLTSTTHALSLGREITNAIPKDGVLLAGTDLGRFLPTFLAGSWRSETPLLVISPNQIMDGLYSEYLRGVYTNRLQLPSVEDIQNAIATYEADARSRIASGKLRPGEEASIVNGQFHFQGTVAFMAINELLCQRLFEQNPDREFFLDPAFPMEWMFPHMEPQGFLFHLHHTSLTRLEEQVVKRDRAYWDAHAQRLLGAWMSEDTTVEAIREFAERVYDRKDYHNFTGDREYAASIRGYQELPAQRSVAKIMAARRAQIAQLYAWRAARTSDQTEQRRLRSESDYAFRQAIALCPVAPEAVFLYVQQLAPQGRFAEALTILRLAVKLDAENETFRTTLRQLEQHETRAGGKVQP